MPSFASLTTYKRAILSAAMHLIRCQVQPDFLCRIVDNHDNGVQLLGECRLAHIAASLSE